MTDVAENHAKWFFGSLWIGITVVLVVTLYDLMDGVLSGILFHGWFLYFLLISFFASALVHFGFFRQDRNKRNSKDQWLKKLNFTYQKIIIISRLSYSFAPSLWFFGWWRDFYSNFLFQYSIGWNAVFFHLVSGWYSAF